MDAPALPPHLATSLVYCPHCETANPPGAAFCGNCGRSMAGRATEPIGPESGLIRQLICPACETANAPDAIFCGNCGYAFAATIPPPASRRQFLWLLVALAGAVFVCTATVALLLTREDRLPDIVAGFFAAKPTAPSLNPSSESGDTEPVNLESSLTPLPLTAEPTFTTEPTTTPSPLPTVTDIILPTLSPFPTPQPPTPIQIPDEIVFQSNRDGDFEIFIMNTDGTNLRQLTINTVDDRFPRVSPDGRRIAYESGRGGKSEIHVMNRDGSGQQRLTFNEELDELPTWSPDSQQIIFVTWVSRTDSELFVMGADGSNLRQITDTPTDEGHVSWSESGLAFNATEPGTDNYQLYASDTNGGNRQRLTNSRIDEWSPEWSPDGTQILFLSERGSSVNSGIYVMDMASKEARPIYNNEDRRLLEWGAVWSADGQQIVFAMDQTDDTADIYIMNADGSSVRRLIERGGYPAWAPGSG